MANKEDHQEVEYLRLREEFNQLIVPLIRKSLQDKPADVAMYCARYFQALVEERQRNSISGNENESVQAGTFATTGEKAEKREAVSQVQESTSLPILTEVRRDRLSLRETSSWSNPSDSSSTPRRLWDSSYDVADATSRIGDQPDKNVAKEDALDAEKCSEKESDNQLFVGDQGSKDREDPKKNERNEDSGIMEASKRSLIDEGSVSSVSNEVEEEFSAVITTSPVDSEGEEESSAVVITSPVDSDELNEELSAIVNSASSSTDVTPGTSYRKKWSSNIDSYLDLRLKSEFAEAIDGEEEFALDSNSKQFSPMNDIAESSTVSLGSTEPNVSLGSDPQLKELASSARTIQSSTAFVQKEIEESVKLVSQSLQDLVKVLDSMRLFCNENLQRVKTLSEAIPEKSLRAPRKQRSVTTFSSSDNLFESKEFPSGAGNKPTTTANKGCSKISRKILELKSNDSGVESDSFGSVRPLRSKKDEEEFVRHKKNSPIEEVNGGASNNLGSKHVSFLDQNLEKNCRNINENRDDSKDTYMNGKSRCKEGVVNKGFVTDDSDLCNRDLRLGHHGQNWWHVNGFRQNMFNKQSPFSGIRIPRPTSRRNFNLTRNHNQTPRQMPGSRFSYIGEGGDVFSTSRRQYSVETVETAIQTTETFDARIRAMRIHPIANGNTEQEARSSEQFSGEISTQDSVQGFTSSLPNEQSSKLSEENPFQNVSVAEGTPSGMNEKVEGQEGRIETKPAKKSSSLNPCAECFNPPSKLVQNLAVLKSPDESDAPNSEQGSPDSADAPVELSIKSFPEVDADWDYEMFLEDFLPDDLDPILYQSVDSDGHMVSLTIEEVEDQHRFENEVRATERNSPCPVSFSCEENGVLEGRDGASPCKKLNRQSDMKLAEGDQGLEEEEKGAERSDSAEKREEPGLNSACGDFVAAENNVGNSGEDSENAQVADAPCAIDFDMGIFPPVNVDDNASQSRKQEEELELNFACFSGSDSSEMDSSDISEEEDEFSSESDENKIKEKA